MHDIRKISLVLLLFLSASFLFGCATVLGDKFTITLFEKDDQRGDPLSGQVYCGETYIGTLVNGSVIANRTLLLKEMGEACNISVFGKYNGVPYEFCGWELESSDLEMMFSYSNYLYWNSTEVQIRHGPCSTKKSFVTPDDPAVIKQLRKYLPVNTDSVQNDIDTIHSMLSDDFNYTLDEVSSKFDDYYYFPSEFFKSKPFRGDCEDWSDAFLSLALARAQVPCYAVGLDEILENGSEASSGHVTVFCNIDGNPMIYDQHSKHSSGIMWEELIDGLQKNVTEGKIASLAIDSYYNNSFFKEITKNEEFNRDLNVKMPAVTDFDKAMLKAFADPNKLLFYLKEDGTSSGTFSGTVRMISNKGTKDVYIPGYLLMDKRELCDNGKERYDALNVTFDDSPVGETWKWTNVTTKYCNDSNFHLSVNSTALEEIKNPRFVLYFFERGDHEGQAIPGSVYCDSKLLGTLQNGELNMSKKELLGIVGEKCKIDVVGYNGYPFEICGWTLDGSDIRTYGSNSFKLGDGDYISDFANYHCH